MMNFIKAIFGFIENYCLELNGIFVENKDLQSYYKELEEKIDEGWTNFEEINHEQVPREFIVPVMLQRYFLSLNDSIIPEEYKEQFDYKMSLGKLTCAIEFYFILFENNNFFYFII